MEYIYVFDYSVPAIYKGIIAENEAWEEWLINHNLKESNCEVMISQTPLEMQELYING